MNVAVPPADTDVFVGCTTTTGATSTVKVAAVLVTEPEALVNSASYSKPFMVAKVLEIVNVLDVVVTPELSGLFENVLLVDTPELDKDVNETPPSVLTSQVTVASGKPVADAVKVAGLPAFTIVLDGSVAMLGALSTDKVAALEVTVDGGGTGEPLNVFVNTASYSN